MNNISASKLIGTVLIVSEDPVGARQLAEAMQELALSAEVCIKVSDALDRVSHRKLEAVVVDFSMGSQATLLLQNVRKSLSNRTAVTFAITNSSTETAFALKAGSSFAFDSRFDTAHSQGRLRLDRTRTPPLLPLSYLRPGSRQQKRGTGNPRQNGKRQRTRYGIHFVSSSDVWLGSGA
jgi:DNA-binding response OmpR family regulator